MFCFDCQAYFMYRNVAASVVLAALLSCANAASVYDKDGNILYLDGRVQSVLYSGNHNRAGENDSSVQNSGRFGIGGKSILNDWISATAYTQWDVADESSNKNFKAREQHVGADFGIYGKVIAGRMLDSSYYAESVTDHYEDAGGTVQSKYNSEYRGGQIQYVYDNYGAHAQFGIQTAQNHAKVLDSYLTFLGVEDRFAVDSGVNFALGYTFSDVGGVPLSVRAGYNRLNGQKNNDVSVYNRNISSWLTPNGVPFDSFEHANIGVSWGELDTGLYLAALYDYSQMDFLSGESTSIVHHVKGLSDSKLESIESKGFELAIGYTFDNGLSALLGYEVSYNRANSIGYNQDYSLTRRVPVYVNYKLNANFNVWGEVGFNAGSDRKFSEFKKEKKEYKNVFSLGARYTF